MNYGGYKSRYQRSTSETEAYLQTLQTDEVEQVISKILSTAKFTSCNNLYVHIPYTYSQTCAHDNTYSHNYEQ